MYSMPKISVAKWMNDDKIPKRPNFMSVYYLREIKDIYRKYGKMEVRLFFFMRSKIYTARNFARMFQSAEKQRALIRAIIQTLKVKAVTPEYEKSFQNQVKAFERRINWVTNMMLENLKNTKYYLYFADKEQQSLLDSTAEYVDDDEYFEVIMARDFETWYEEHKAEVDKYVEDTAEVREKEHQYRQEIYEKVQAEKEAVKAYKKAKKKEEDYILKSREKEKKRIRKENRDFERAYLGESFRRKVDRYTNE